MRKVQLILGFLLFCFQIWGQGFERTFHLNDPRLIGFDRVDKIESINEEAWLLSTGYYRNDTTGQWRIGSYIYKSLYYPHLDSLGTPKLFYNWGGGSGISQEWNQVQELRFKQNYLVSVQFYNAYPFHDFMHGSLRDASYSGFTYSSFFAACFRYEYYNGEYLGLFATTTLKEYQDGLNEADTLLLVKLGIRADTVFHEVLDTFALEQAIVQPGTFIYHSHKRIEYFNDSLRYVFSRGNFNADTFQVQKFPFYTPNNSFSREALFNSAMRRDRLLKEGQYRITYDSLGYNILQTHLNRFGQKKVVHAFNLPAYAKDLPAEKVLHPWPTFQNDSVVNVCVLDQASNRLNLIRYVQGVIVKELSYQAPERFKIESIASLEDGSFILGGGTEYPGWRGSTYTKAALIKVDPTGRSTILVGEEEFNLHYNSIENTLQVFYEDQEYLDYRILDVAGRSMKKGRMRVARGIPLGDWRTGIYYLQLWTEQGAFIGTKSFLKN